MFRLVRVIRINYAYTTWILEVTCIHKRPPHQLKTILNVFPITACALAMLSHATVSAQEIQSSTEEAANNVAVENWVSYENLSPEQRALVPEACCGLYIDSDLPSPITDNSYVVSAGSSDFNANTQLVDIENGIDVRFDDFWLQAESGLLNQLDSVIDLEGNIRLRQPGLTIGASSAKLKQNENTAELHDSSYILNETAARGSAESIIFKNADGTLSIQNGSYTVCEPGDNSWLLSGSSIELDQASGRGIGRDITLRIKDIPIFYTPYISFPLTTERSSGFLFPSIGSTREGGFDLAVPYYFNLAPNYDATFTPRLMTERGLMLNLEARQIGKDSSNTLAFGYLPKDSQYDATSIGQAGSESPPREKRWQVNYQGNKVFSPNWSASANFSAISDFDYLQDFGSNGVIDSSQSFLSRHGEISYRKNALDFQAALESYQLIDPSQNILQKPFSSLPRLSLGYQKRTDSSWVLGLESEYVYFDRNLDRNSLSQSQIDNGILVTGQRLNIEPSLAWHWDSSGLFVKPELSYNYTNYQLEDQALGSADNPERGLFIGELDAGLLFDREVKVKNSNYLQTLEPRLFYLYSEYDDQSNLPLFDTTNLSGSFDQLFRENRFSGKDRITDANQLTLALSSRILDNSGREKAKASIGQIFYFEDRRVSLLNPSALSIAQQQQSSSALATELSYNFNKYWRASTFQEWDHDSNALRTGNFQFRYQSDINHILNFSYRYRKSDNLPGIIKQTDISASWPINDSLNFIGRWNYDHENDRSVESIAGIQYSNCCWSISLVARQWVVNNALFGSFIENNNGIFLQFELKGLGNVLGSSIDSLIGESITGFNSYVENY